LSPFERLTDAPHGWNKTAHNWRIAGAMSEADLRATDVGQFLATLGSSDTVSQGAL
jgi:hypothetical protein